MCILNRQGRDINGIPLHYIFSALQCRMHAIDGAIFGNDINRGSRKYLRRCDCTKSFDKDDPFGEGNGTVLENIDVKPLCTRVL